MLPMTNSSDAVVKKKKAKIVGDESRSRREPTWMERWHMLGKSIVFEHVQESGLGDGKRSKVTSGRGSYFACIVETEKDEFTTLLLQA